VTLKRIKPVVESILKSTQDKHIYSETIMFLLCFMNGNFNGISEEALQSLGRCLAEWVQDY
jgi:hypothetical protein